MHINAPKYICLCARKNSVCVTLAWRWMAGNGWLRCRMGLSASNCRVWRVICVRNHPQITHKNGVILANAMNPHKYRYRVLRRRWWACHTSHSISLELYASAVYKCNSIMFDFNNHHIYWLAQIFDETALAANSVHSAYGMFAVEKDGIIHIDFIEKRNYWLWYRLLLEGLLFDRTWRADKRNKSPPE